MWFPSGDFAMISTRYLRWVILGVVVVVSGTIGFFILRPANMNISVGSVSVMGTDADLKMDRVHIVQNKQGLKNWEMWADTAKVYQKKDYTQLENIRLRFYPKNGKIMNVTADKGQMENESRNMHLQGNVLILSQDGLSLRTESLRFHPKEKRIHTEEKIVVEGKSFRLTGVGLHGRTDLGEYSLKEKVKAVLHDPKLSGSNGFSASANASGRNSAPGGETP